jgi:hypothetical protein
MKASILFPYRIEDDNRNAFAFTMDMARRSSSDIIALTPIDKLESTIRNKKDEIYCNLLEMKGYYHGRINQWNAFDEVNIHVNLINHAFNEAICSAMKDYDDLVVVVQQKYFSGTGLFEEIFSSPMKGNVTFFILPGNIEFDEPFPNLIGVLNFQLQESCFILFYESFLYGVLN